MVVISLLNHALASKIKGLYNDEDKVFVLNSKTFGENVFDSESVWLIEFYNSWCGHCIHFAPTYKEFAAEKTGMI